MANINLHCYPSDMVYESRIRKQAASIEKTKLFNRIILLGIKTEKQQARTEAISDTILIKRMRTFGVKNRLLIYLMYHCYVLYILLRYRPKVINFHALEVLGLAVLAKRLLQANIIYDTHELETEKTFFSDKRRQFSKWYEKKLIKYVDALVVVGWKIAEVYLAMYGVKALVLPNMPNKTNLHRNQYLRQHFAIQDDVMLCLHHGVLTEKRGIETMLALFSQRLNKAKYKIVFVGFGPLVDTIKDYANRYESIYYHAAVDDETLLNIAASADIGLAFPPNDSLSYELSLPNKLLQYAVAGLYIIASDLSEYKKLIETYQLGHTVDQTDMQRIASAIMAVKREDLQQRVAALPSLQNELSWQRFEENYQALFFDLVKREQYGD